MARLSTWYSPAAKLKRTLRIGIRNLMLLVALCAFITWLGIRAWKSFRVDESIRLLNSGTGTFDEKFTAAANLRVAVSNDDVELAIGTCKSSPRPAGCSDRVPPL